MILLKQLITEDTELQLEPELQLETLSFSDLLKWSDRPRKIRSKNVRTRSLPVSSTKEGESWNFRYKSYPSTTGLPWQGRIVFLESHEKSMIDHPCKVDCSCPDYRYKWAYANTDKDASYVGNQSLSKNNGNFPRITNPTLTPGLCKHLISLRDFLRTKLKESNQHSLSEGLNYIVSRYPTFELNVEE